jgi:formate/nitrite transporter FocA (FNT family)
MSGMEPSEIWDSGVDEGERRLTRGSAGLAATGLVGGVDVMLGILALCVVSGAAGLVLPQETAHVVGSLFFGIGFVFIVLGRSELFTENFLIPVSAVFHRLGSGWSLARLWAVTLAFNLIGLGLLSLIFTRAGLVPPETLKAAGRLAETFADRDLVAALLSAVVAGTIMTLFTWLTHAAEESATRLLTALVVGFLLAAPSLNHAVVSFGEMAFGILAGTGRAGWPDLARNFPVAVIGNLIGGLGFVTLARLVQVRGEPGGARGR